MRRELRMALATAGTVLAMTAAPAQADAYIGFGSGRASVHERLFGASDDFAANDTSMQYFVGAKIGRHLRFEIGRTDLGLLEDTVTIGGLPSVNDFSVDGRTLSLLFSDPIGDDLSVYLRAGVFDWNSTRNVNNGASIVRQDGQNGLWGVGASLRVSDDLTLRAEYQLLRVGPAQYTMPALTVSYHF